MSEQELLSLSEAAKRYGVPMGTLRDAMYRGQISGRKIGNQWVLEAKAVEAFLTQRPKRGRPPKNQG